MDEKIGELALQAKIQMCSEARLQEFAELIIKECIIRVKNAPKHCAYTTYDLSMVDCAINTCVKELQEFLNESRT
jgi:hypothetical protein